MGGKASKTSPTLDSEGKNGACIGEKDNHPQIRVESDPGNVSNRDQVIPKPAAPHPRRPTLVKKSTVLDAMFIAGEDLPRNHRLSPIRTSKPGISGKQAELQGALGGSARSILSETSWHSDNSSLYQIKYQNYEYPFENVVFEGGGVKGLAYAGAIRELENIGVWQNVKRFSGTSAGSMWAALAALGYNSYEVEDFLRQDLKSQFLDAIVYCSILPNLKKHFGWHPGRKIFRWFGKVIEAKTGGDANITFKELYDWYGKELCVVVTNVNMMDAEYCHVKTTPSLPIRTAVRMSMAIPGLFGAVKYKRYGRTDVYVDGGVLCNYPIHCFDGWWLSMKRQDSFLCRLKPLHDLPHLWEKEERFGDYNEKTIGMVLVSPHT
ncbi:hypothetical protein BSL78_20142 [Apostichopus japonicus]|uniref:PNPLA domain-containing protein n=1 Tax=Stichopus japonicus TaxID=307972 RepID=A0A2G8K4R8_STIJA|nr:hypothetical protein BSL78_20142 [Apostichopus japonicus]